MNTKIIRNILIDEIRLNRLDEAKTILHKRSRNAVIIEAIDNLLNNLTGIPKNIDEAIKLSYGASNTFCNQAVEKVIFCAIPANAGIQCLKNTDRIRLWMPD